MPGSQRHIPSRTGSQNSRLFTCDTADSHQLASNMTQSACIECASSGCSRHGKDSLACRRLSPPAQAQSQHSMLLTNNTACTAQLASILIPAARGQQEAWHAAVQQARQPAAGQTPSGLLCTSTTRLSLERWHPWKTLWSYKAPQLVKVALFQHKQAPEETSSDAGLLWAATCKCGTINMCT